MRAMPSSWSRSTRTHASTWRWAHGECAGGQDRPNGRAVARNRRGDPVTSRRTLIAGIAASLLGGPVNARAQQAGRIYRLGILGNVPGSDSQGAKVWGAFTQGLRDLGYV